MSKPIAHAPWRVGILAPRLKLLQMKQRGDIGEVAFLERALCLGYTCSKPYGDNASYDWVVGGSSRRLKRVQVKAAFGLHPTVNFYFVNSDRANRQPYKPAELDFLAVYIVPEDVWYIIPPRAFGTRASLFFRPFPMAQDRWRKYREAWWRLGKVAPRC